MNTEEVRRRAREIESEVRLKTAQAEAGEITAKAFSAFIDQAYAQSDRLAAELKNSQHVNGVMAAQEQAFAGGIQNKALGLGSGRAPSPRDLTEPQLRDLYQAAELRRPFATEITTKSPVFEGAISGGVGQLPPIMVPQRFLSLPYEPTRVRDFLMAAVMPGPSVTWLQHSANAAEAGIVGEGQPKPDISPTIVEQQSKPTKIAALVSVSVEAWQDYDSFGQWLPTELTRSLINQENSLFLNAVAGTGGATFNGFLSESGTLTRAQGADTPLDCLNKAFLDLRTSSSAFAQPDLMLVHPNTWAAIRRSKDANGRYLMDLLAGPLGLTADGTASRATPSDANEGGVIPFGSGDSSRAGQIWGVPVVETTQCTPGTAVVLSVRAGAGVVYQRMGLWLTFDSGLSGTNFENNVFTWRIEQRVALAIPRPGAVNIVTGLPAS